MRTARSSTIVGGLCLPPDKDPLDKDPLDKDPPRQRPPGTETPLDRDPPEQRIPVDRMTHACETITLPETSFAGGNNIIHLRQP